MGNGIPGEQSMVEVDEEFKTEKEALRLRIGQSAGSVSTMTRYRVSSHLHLVKNPKTNPTSPHPQASSHFSAPYTPPSPQKNSRFRQTYHPPPNILLLRLIVLVSAGGSYTSMINSYGGLVLGIAALDGLLLGSEFFVMETSAMRGVTRLCDIAFGRVLSQDKSCFDRPELTRVVVKDGDDARTLIAVVLGQIVAVDAMMTVGLVWAMTWGLLLMLVGLAIGPVFVGVMGLQTGLMAMCDVRNKRSRDEVARVYYEFLTVRGIRAMSVRQVQFDKGLHSAFPLVYAVHSWGGVLMASPALLSTWRRGFLSTSALCLSPRALTHTSRCAKSSTSSFSPTPSARNSCLSLNASPRPFSEQMRLNGCEKIPPIEQAFELAALKELPIG